MLKLMFSAFMDVDAQLYENLLVLSNRARTNLFYDSRGKIPGANKNENNAAMELPVAMFPKML